MITVRITGLNKLQGFLGKFPKSLDREIARAIRRSAFILEAKTKPLVPVDTGLLRRQTRPWEITPTFALIESRTDYAIFVHEGTRGRKGRPYLLQGAKKSERAIEIEFENAIKRAINKSK